MAAPPPAPELMEELVGEILRRLPPDQPACLFRASVVSKSWNRLVSDPAALRRYREFHGAPPLLGFLQNTHTADDPIPRFVPTTTASPFFQPEFRCKYWMALDCRHGRVLVHTLEPLGLLVWNPVTGDQEPLPAEPPLAYNHFAGAVLCAADGCDHLDCRGGPFRVVFVATASEDVDGVFTWGSVYSPETGVWTAPSVVHPGPVMAGAATADVMGPSLLVGDTVYFTLDLEASRVILKYDVGRNALSTMDAPPLGVRTMFLVTAEDGGLGVATIEGYILNLWSRQPGDDGVLRWVLGRSISLDDSTVHLTMGVPNTEFHVVGFAEGANIIFVRANDGISTVDMKSGHMKKVSDMSNFNAIFPCVTFYTFGLGGVF